ncbi:MAG: hypothetical protein RRE78_10125 [Acidianus sp.]|nr:hypothetical protein [Acidianus sp.]
MKSVLFTASINEEYMALDENGEVIDRFKDVNSLYEFVKEKTEEGKRIKIKEPEEVYFLLRELRLKLTIRMNGL